MNEAALIAALERAVAAKAREREAKENEQVITGAYGTQDYAAVVSCYRQREKLMIHGVLYRVCWVETDAGRFRAGVVRCKKQPRS